MLHIVLALPAVVAAISTRPGGGVGTNHPRAASAAAVQNLIEWAQQQHDVRSMIHGVTAAPSRLDGTGLVATRPLDKGSVVLTVPSELALTVETIDGDSARSSSRSSERSNTRRLPWFVQMSSHLVRLDRQSSVRRLRKGQAVDMRPWLDCLPRSFDTPIHWDEDLLQELQYSHMVDAVARQLREWEQWYEICKANNNNNQDSSLSWDDFVWGCECARSRAFSGGYTGDAFNPFIYAFTLLLVTAYVGLNLGTLEQAANGAALVVCASILNDFVVPKLFRKRRYVICPVMDLANHESSSTMGGAAAAAGDVSFEFFGDAYSLALVRDVPAEQEVTISYGDRSNDQLLQFYGFVERDNPNDVYVMPPLRGWNIDALEQACGRSFAPGRLQKLERAGLLGTTPDDHIEEKAATTTEESANPLGGVVLTRAGGMDPAVMQALRALVSSEEEWQAAGEAIGNFAVEYSGGAENERLARLAAKKAVELELQSKPTTLEQDEQLLKTAMNGLKKSAEASMEKKLAIQFRMEKKKLLAETLEKLSL